MVYNKYMNITKCTIYWAHLPEHTDPMTEGYIGITKRNLDIRKKEHYQLVANGSQKLFHKKLRKHNNIIWTVIGFCFSVHTSLIIERAFRTNIKGTWNSQKGGNSFPNMNEEIRRKIGEANSGNKSSTNKIKENTFLTSYEESLNLCFLEKPQLIKFDSNSTDEDIDNFLNSL